MTDKMKALWLGIFILVAFILLTWLILFLRPSVGDGKVRLNVHFSNIDKISKGSRVTLAGRPVGEVKKIEEVANPREAPADPSGNLYIYDLTLEVDSSVSVYSYDEIVFATSGLLGEKSIAIIPKATPKGAPPAQNVTKDILFARSTDTIEQTLNQLSQLSTNFEGTSQEIRDFIHTNNQDLNAALKSLITSMGKADLFFTAAEQNRLIERMGYSFENFTSITGQIACGEGTIGRLITSDCFFVQFTTVLAQMQTFLDAVNNYGLLYQFDRKWQRVHDTRKW